MSSDQSKERLTKNEQLIRDKNTAAANGIKHYYREEVEIENAPIAFVCECSRLDCNEHVNISIESFKRLHTERDHFVIFRGHNTPLIEQVVAREDDFDIVEKHRL